MSNIHTLSEIVGDKTPIISNNQSAICLKEQTSHIYDVFEW
jgi:hypothetical protein